MITISLSEQELRNLCRFLRISLKDEEELFNVNENMFKDVDLRASCTLKITTFTYYLNIFERFLKCSGNF